MKTNRPQWRERFVQAAQKWRENSAPASESWRWSEVRLKSAMFVMLLEHAVEKSCKWLVKTGTSWTKYGSNGSENVITAIFKKLVLMCLLHLDCAKNTKQLLPWSMIEVWNCLFFFLQVRVVGLAEPGSPTIMHRSMELRALEQQRFRWMLKK